MANQTTGELLVGIGRDIKNINDRTQRIETQLQTDYATKSDLELIDQKYATTQKLVYSLVGLILTAVVLGLLAFIVVRPK